MCFLCEDRLLASGVGRATVTSSLVEDCGGFDEGFEGYGIQRVDGEKVGMRMGSARKYKKAFFKKLLRSLRNVQTKLHPPSSAFSQKPFRSLLRSISKHLYNRAFTFFEKSPRKSFRKARKKLSQSFSDGCDIPLSQWFPTYDTRWWNTGEICQNKTESKTISLIHFSSIYRYT